MKSVKYQPAASAATASSADEVTVAPCDSAILTLDVQLLDKCLYDALEITITVNATKYISDTSTSCYFTVTIEQ